MRTSRPVPVNPDPALRLPQAAEYIGVSTKSLRRYIKAGTLRFVRLGELAYGIRVSECERFLNGEPLPEAPKATRRAKAAPQPAA